MKQVPFTADLLATSGMQLAMLVQPLALPHPSEEPIQVPMIITLKFLHRLFLNRSASCISFCICVYSFLKSEVLELANFFNYGAFSLVG